MDKAEAVIWLKNKGYNAYTEDNIVKINICSKSEKETERTLKRIKKDLKECGYNASFGVKVHAAKI